MMHKPLTVLALCDGISCGQLAMHRSGNPVACYYASEIDPRVIAVTQTHFPNTIQLGDMLRWRDWDIDWTAIDLIFSSTPCQSFSTFGIRDFSGLGLMQAAFDIFEHCTKARSEAGLPPPAMLGENVIGAAKHIIAEVEARRLALSVYKINSRDFSATRRPRTYYTNLPYPVPSAACPHAFSEVIPRALMDVAPLLPPHMHIRKTSKMWCFAKTARRADYVTYELRCGGTGALRHGQIWEASEPSYCLVSSSLENAFGHPDGTIRRVTPEICEMLMGLPSGYTLAAVTRTARALAIANAWQIATVTAFLAPLSNPQPPEQKCQEAIKTRQTTNGTRDTKMRCKQQCGCATASQPAHQSTALPTKSRRQSLTRYATQDSKTLRSTKTSQ